MITTKVVPKPDIEHFRKFQLLDRMPARHLNYLREKSLIVDYVKGDILFRPPRSISMGYYLLEGTVEIQVGGNKQCVVEAGSGASYCSLEEKLPEQASAVASGKCKVLQLNRSLVEQYFSWTTGEHKAVDIEAISRDREKRNSEWIKSLLNSLLIKKLSSEKFKQLLPKFEDIKLKKSHVILHKGEVNQYFFVLRAGSAKLIQPNDQQKVLSSGNFFGEESLIPDAASSVQVEMIEDGTIARLSKKYFNLYIKDALINYIDRRQLDTFESSSYAILDVRLPAEFKVDHADNSINIPVSALKRRLHELDKHRIYILSIESGARGELACYMLLQEGFQAFVLEDEYAMVEYKLHG